ncbi:ABC transporter permease [Rhodococcus sp. NPDC060084]|uniref:ABC transporter permease n=1 Tax=Rhodococcus sp. NPDC060084 TaxID=3347053 RepID=UPI0036658579
MSDTVEIVTPPAVAPKADLPKRRVPPRARAVAAAVAPLWLVAALMIVWEITARAVPTVFFPPVSAVMEQFVDDWLSTDPFTLFLSEGFWDAVPVSLGRFAQGWALAVIVGIGVGVALGRSPILAGMYNPTVRFFMALPNAALLPIAFQIFGATSSMNVFLIFFGTVWVILVNTADGVAGVDRQWIRSARSLQLSRPQFYLRVLLPAASPRIMAGLRISVGIGLILMIISELYATTEGLGYNVVLYQQTFMYRQMWSAFVLIALLGIVLNGIVNTVERRLLRWNRRAGLADL